MLGLAWLVSWEREFRTLVKSDTLWDVSWIDKTVGI